MTKITRTIEKTMYYNAPEFIIRLAKELRANQTKAEKELWKIIGAKKLMGLHFRRQHPVNMYITDFYCHSIRLAIEIDGEIHKKNEKHENDLNRTAELERLGITVVRFSNDDVLNNLDMVKMRIEKICGDLMRDSYSNKNQTVKVSSSPSTAVRIRRIEHLSYRENMEKNS